MSSFDFWVTGSLDFSDYAFVASAAGNCIAGIHFCDEVAIGPRFDCNDTDHVD
jgi:hypothetical protein